jgi:hypothetical protein
MKTEKPRSAFVLCIRNEGTDDLELRKVYQVLPDRAATREGLVRLIDESGEDYLYPVEYFVPVKLPAIAAKQFVVPANAALRSTVGKRRRA